MDTTACRHIREHTSVLASVERRTLLWIAIRLPALITSDHLSVLGLTSMLAVGIGFAAFRVTPWAAAVVVVALAANWFGDSLDGTVARVRGQERPRYGFYVDHVIDLLGTAFLFGGLACSGLMSPLLAVILLASYAIVCAETYLATHATGVFRMSFLGFGPTELRLVLAAGALKATDGTAFSLAGAVDVRLFDAGAVIAILGLAAAFVVSAARNTRALYRAEPLPMGRSGSSAP
jgi:archaetidylinositol phosphate synthase